VLQAAIGERVAEQVAPMLGQMQVLIDSNSRPRTSSDNSIGIPLSQDEREANAVVDQQEDPRFEACFCIQRVSICMGMSALHWMSALQGDGCSSGEDLEDCSAGTLVTAGPQASSLFRFSCWHLLVG